MTYTTQQLQAMSDKDINKALMVKLGFELSNWLNDDFGHYKHGATTIARVIDYCSNPNDIMPLAFERKIGGHYGKATPDLYFAVARLDKRIYCDTNPLRAIACLILMMED